MEEKPEITLDEKYGLRPLTRGELKRFKKQGYSLVAIDKLTRAKASDFIDQVVELVCRDLADDVPNPESNKLFIRIAELTFGIEEKNSSRPGAGKKAAGRKNAKPVKKKAAKNAKKNRRK